MESFKVDSKGDVIIKNNAIEMVKDNSLLAQKVQQVLKTNLGEWCFNENEGIDFQALLCKNPNYEQIEDNIKSGLLQVDETFEMTSFECSLKNRRLFINFTARNENGEEIAMTL